MPLGSAVVLMSVIQLLPFSGCGSEESAAPALAPEASGRTPAGFRYRVADVSLGRSSCVAIEHGRERNRICAGAFDEGNMQLLPGAFGRDIVLTALLRDPVKAVKSRLVGSGETTLARITRVDDVRLAHTAIAVGKPLSPRATPPGLEVIALDSRGEVIERQQLQLGLAVRGARPQAAAQ